MSSKEKLEMLKEDSAPLTTTGVGSKLKYSGPDPVLVISQATIRGMPVCDDRKMFLISLTRVTYVG